MYRIEVDIDRLTEELRDCERQPRFIAELFQESCDNAGSSESVTYLSAVINEMISEYPEKRVSRSCFSIVEDSE